MSFATFNDPFDIFFTKLGERDPQINVGHNKKEAVLHIALPGYSRSDVNVEVNAGRLTVTAKGQKLSSDYEYPTRGIFLGDYSRTWSLPKSVNTEAVEASYEAGIVTVKLPYNQNNRETTRKIELR